MEQGIRDGALLRGEVLARWQEFVGTGDIMRALQARVGRAARPDGRRASPAARRPASVPGGDRLGAGDPAQARRDRRRRAGRTSPGRRIPAGAALLAAAPNLTRRPSDDLDERIARLTRDWQRSVLDLVRTEAGDKRVARPGRAYAVNATGLLVMVAVFAATAFIPTGLEIVVAGGTTVTAQKVLEAIFGDQAVRYAGRAGQARTCWSGSGALFDDEADRLSQRAGRRRHRRRLRRRALRAASTAVQLARADVRLDPDRTPDERWLGMSLVDRIKQAIPRQGGHGGRRPPRRPGRRAAPFRGTRPRTTCRTPGWSPPAR